MITVNVFDLTRKKMLIHAIKIENRRKKNHTHTHTIPTNQIWCLINIFSGLWSSELGKWRCWRSNCFPICIRQWLWNSSSSVWRSRCNATKSIRTSLILSTTWKMILSVHSIPKHQQTANNNKKFDVQQTLASSFYIDTNQTNKFTGACACAHTQTHAHLYIQATPNDSLDRRQKRFSR